jgi:hypothetical protein
MSVGLILKYLLKELNKILLCEPLASIILFYSTSSINLVLNLHEYNILLHFQIFSAFLTRKKLILPSQTGNIHTKFPRWVPHVVNNMR